MSMDGPKIKFSVFCSIEGVTAESCYPLLYCSGR